MAHDESPPPTIHRKGAGGDHRNAPRPDYVRRGRPKPELTSARKKQHEAAKVRVGALLARQGEVASLVQCANQAAVTIGALDDAIKARAGLPAAQRPEIGDLEAHLFWDYVELAAQHGAEVLPTAELDPELVQALNQIVKLDRATEDGRRLRAARNLLQVARELLVHEALGATANGVPLPDEDPDAVLERVLRDEGFPTMLMAIARSNSDRDTVRTESQRQAIHRRQRQIRERMEPVESSIRDRHQKQFEADLGRLKRSGVPTKHLAQLRADMEHELLPGSATIRALARHELLAKELGENPRDVGFLMFNAEAFDAQIAADNAACDAAEKAKAESAGQASAATARTAAKSMPHPRSAKPANQNRPKGGRPPSRR